MATSSTPGFLQRGLGKAARLVSRAISPPLADAHQPGAGRSSVARPGPVVADMPLDIATALPLRGDRLPRSGPTPWLDAPDAEERVESALAAGRLSPLQASLCRTWVRDGVVVLPAFFTRARLAAAWAAYERAIADGRIVLEPEKTAADDPHPGRFLNPHFHVPEIDALLRDAGMVDTVSLLLGARALPFQTITSHKGSQQSAHSDSIHMTTYPLGYLAANWIACEDVDPDCGPLEYYPGSHKLPYLFSADVGIELDDVRSRGYVPYAERYEPAVQRLIEAHGLRRSVFLPKAGDVLLWHGNILHGGAARARVEPSRRAVVCHYFAEGTITYHDYTGQPSHLHPAPVPA